MVRHLENMRKFGVNPVVAINVFSTDTQKEIDAIREIRDGSGAWVSRWRGTGRKAARGQPTSQRWWCKRVTSRMISSSFYPVEWSIKRKIETIATEIYRADGVDYTPEADKQIETFEKNGFGGLPICMAKTHLSFTADASIKGAPTGFRLPIREARASVGAGFIYRLRGDADDAGTAQEPGG